MTKEEDKVLSSLSVVLTGQGTQSTVHLPPTAPKILFNGSNLCQRSNFVERTLKPGELLDHLKNNYLVAEDSSILNG